MRSKNKNRVEINSRGMEWRKCPNKSGLVILLGQEKKMAIPILDENMTGLRTREKKHASLLYKFYSLPGFE